MTYCRYPMHIAHVNSEVGYSGGEHQVFLLIEELARLGVKNTLVAPPRSRSLAIGAELGLPCLEVPFRSDLDLASVIALTRRLRRQAYDLVHLHTGRATWLGGLAAWRAGLPAVTTRRMDRGVKRSWRTRLIYGHFVQRAVAISPAVLDCLREGGVSEERSLVIWDAVDAESVRGGRREAVRTELGDSRDGLVLLTMASLVRRKGIDVLIEALKLAGGLEATLWICGQGPAEQDLRERAAPLGERVRFLGWREDKRDLLAAADIFVLPSRREGVGVAALEAMAAGLPVVASKVGGLGQVIVDGMSGLLVPPEDPRALADALARLGEDADLRRELGARASERAEAEFSATQQARAYHAVYSEILESRS